MQEHEFPHCAPKWMTYYTYQRCMGPTICWCLFKLPCNQNNLLHTSQMYSHSPVCMCKCVFRLPRSMNYLLQTSHTYHSPPICTQWCGLKFCLTVNDLLHTSQVYGYSPLCRWWCLLRLPCYLNVLLSTSKVNSCSPRCTCWCTFRVVQSVWIIYCTHHGCMDVLHYALMYLQMMQHPELLKTHITHIWTFSTMYVLMYNQDYPAAWMTYYTHHRYTGILHNIHLTVSAQYYAAWVLHYTYHWVPDNPHQVRVDTHSKYTGRRREKKSVVGVKTRLNHQSHRGKKRK